MMNETRILEVSDRQPGIIGLTAMISYFMFF